MYAFVYILHPSIHSSVDPLICLFHVFVSYPCVLSDTSVHSFIYPSVHPFFCPYLSNHSPICLPFFIYPIIHPYIHPLFSHLIMSISIYLVHPCPHSFIFIYLLHHYSPNHSIFLSVIVQMVSLSIHPSTSPYAASKKAPVS